MPLSLDRKSTRLNSSHGSISYAVFCLKKKNIETSPINIWIRVTPVNTRKLRARNCEGLSKLWLGGRLSLLMKFKLVFFFNDTATTEICPLSLHDALPIYEGARHQPAVGLRRDGRDVRRRPAQP